MMFFVATGVATLQFNNFVEQAFLPVSRVRQECLTYRKNVGDEPRRYKNIILFPLPMWERVTLPLPLPSRERN
jgi:hypothetical protein